MTHFDRTILACNKLGLDISKVSLATLRVFYNVGVVFSERCEWTDEQRTAWRTEIEKALFQDTNLVLTNGHEKPIGIGAWKPRN